jgi:hypothetical protein
MKKKYAIVIFHIFILNVFGEARMKDVNSLDELERIVGKIEIFKKMHSRFPISLDEMITEPPANYDVKGLLAICRRSGFGISYLLINTNEILVQIQEENLIYECRNNENRFFFFRNGVLIREYTRDSNGNVMNEKSYVFDYPFNDLFYE